MSKFHFWLQALKMSNIFSSEQQLSEISNILIGYLKFPFTGDIVPGALMESVISSVRNGEVLNTYDFVDVINKKEKVGWQVKSTKDSTPVTWKRAKIPNSPQLIQESKESEKGLQYLGDSIIKFCNDHAIESFETYDLDEIGFSRLIVHKNGALTYFEKILCTKNSPKIFNEEDFEWKWSVPKKTKKKEQLPALHGIHKKSQKKWFAWHGLGENQLHFSGEKEWWPKDSKNNIKFAFPSERLSQPELMKLLSQVSSLT
jgi:hypothetical protein